MTEPASPQPNPGWVSAHVFHADPLDALLVDAVAPLVATLTGAGLIDGYFFLRYWEAGPHLRLRLRPAGGQPERATEAQHLITERVGGYLAAHPSTRQLTAQQYAALADQLATGEALPCYERALRPNDSIAFIDYRPEHDFYGAGESLAAVERHFGESSELALGVLTAATPPPQRAAVALAVLILTLAVSEPDLGRAAAWFTTGRIQQNLAAGGHPGSGELTGFEAGYRQRRAALLRQTVRLWEAAGRPDHPDGPGQEPLSGWLRSVQVLRARLTQLRTYGQTPARGPDAITLVLSWCAHLLCNRLGLSLTDEAYLRFLLARALSELTVTEGRSLR